MFQTSGAAVVGLGGIGDGCYWDAGRIFPLSEMDCKRGKRSFDTDRPCLFRHDRRDSDRTPHSLFGAPHLLYAEESIGAFDGEGFAQTQIVCRMDGSPLLPFERAIVGGLNCYPYYTIFLSTAPIVTLQANKNEYKIVIRKHSLVFESKHPRLIFIKSHYLGEEEFLKDAISALHEKVECGEGCSHTHYGIDRECLGSDFV